MKKVRFICVCAVLLAFAACTKAPTEDPSSDTPAIVSEDPSEDTMPDPSQKDDTDYTQEISVSERADDFVESGRQGNITYQLLVYSFADSDGNGIGDFKGIEQHLDYISSLGATAIWLSPVHPAMSYHGYDVTDYSALNKEYGTEEDFKSLVHAAHQKGIKIYLDYVLNHAGKDHPYFQRAAKSREDQWRTAFIFSQNPAADIKAGKIEMIPSGDGYESSQWYAAPASGNLGAKGRFHFVVDFTQSSKPTVTVTETTADAQNPNSDTSVNVYLFYGSSGSVRMYKTADKIYEITVNFNSDWGFLIRTSTTAWGNDKWGAAAGDQTVTFGKAKTLVNADAANDITFAAVDFYHSHMWTDWFADWNYHSVAKAEKSLAFNHLASTVDKWIGYGIDGLRLDAVRHIYHNSATSDNPVFLGKWYDRCNEAYHQAGGEGDFYMVGEMYGAWDEVAPYYKGLPAFFEFDFWNRLEWVLNAETGCYFYKDIAGYQNRYATYRKDYIEATKLSNHDEDRAASRLGKSLPKIKQAAAFLMTAAGEPYIYQGEELGYYGTKQNGDEWVRTPIMWNADGSELASKKLGTKLDKAMLTPEISVEKQDMDLESVYSVYRRFADARNTYAALGKGTMSRHAKYNDGNTSAKAAAVWYMTAPSGDKMLVVHNVGASDLTLDLSGDDLSEAVVSLGTYNVSGTSLTLAGNSSVVFMQ
ncbi:MAG: alpha-amylase [Bacteroidales bacterium]|nr:alpha-amylase [Bacteroidales bacterium]